jgi:hypothetical protein
MTVARLSHRALRQLLKSYCYLLGVSQDAWFPGAIILKFFRQVARRFEMR